MRDVGGDCSRGCCEPSSGSASEGYSFHALLLEALIAAARSSAGTQTDDSEKGTALPRPPLQRLLKGFNYQSPPPSPESPPPSCDPENVSNVSALPPDCQPVE